MNRDVTKLKWIYVMLVVATVMYVAGIVGSIADTSPTVVYSDKESITIGPVSVVPTEVERELFAGLALKETKRSSSWPSVRAKYIAEHARCEACGRNDKRELTVHHVRPVHLYPELELATENLMTLCDRCHFVFGHLGDWRAWNSDAREQAAEHLKAVKDRRYERSER